MVINKQIPVILIQVVVISCITRLSDANRDLAVRSKFSKVFFCHRVSMGTTMNLYRKSP